MSSDWLIGLELLLTLGLVLVFGFWQLWSLRRDESASKRNEQKRED